MSERKTIDENELESISGAGQDDNLEEKPSSDNEFGESLLKPDSPGGGGPSPELPQGQPGDGDQDLQH